MAQRRHRCARRRRGGGGASGGGKEQGRDASVVTLNWRWRNASADLCNKQTRPLPYRSSDTTLTNILSLPQVAVHIRAPSKYSPTPHTPSRRTRQTKSRQPFFYASLLQNACRTRRGTFSLYSLYVCSLNAIQYTVTMFLIDVSPSMGKLREVELSDCPEGETRTVEMTNLQWSLRFVLLKIQEMVCWPIFPFPDSIYKCVCRSTTVVRQTNAESLFSVLKVLQLLPP